MGDVERDGVMQREKWSESLPLVPCLDHIDEWSEVTGEDMGSQERFINQFSTLYCTPKSDFMLRGAYTSPNFDYIQVELHPCVGRGCKSPAQITEYLLGKSINFLYTDKYMDKAD